MSSLTPENLLQNLLHESPPKPRSDMDIRKPRTTVSCRHLPAPNSTPNDTKETQRACPTVYHDHRIANSTSKPSSLSLVDHSATRYLLQTPLREKEPHTLDSPHHRNPQKPVILSHTTPTVQMPPKTTTIQHRNSS